MAMAESPDPFNKLQEQIICAVCLDVFTQPKVLSCNHAFCKECIDRLLVDVEEGNHIVKCPTCRKQITLPQHDTANLPPAFHINTLIELYQVTRRATVIVTDPPAKAPKEEGCPKHGRPLDMYCDDCHEAACAKCFHDDHRDHKCNFVADVFDEHKKEIDDHLVRVQEQEGVVLDALDILEFQEREIAQQGEMVKNQIDVLIGEIIEAVQQSGRQLKENVSNEVQKKLSNISRQKKYGEMLLTQFRSCQEYVKDRVHKGSQQEILLEKNKIIERLKAVSQELILQELQTKERADIIFQCNRDLLEKCSKIGEVHVSVLNNKVVPGNAIDISQHKPLEKHNSKVAIVGMPRTIGITIYDVSKKKRGKLFCYLAADKGGTMIQCKIEHREKDEHCITFYPTIKGTYHIIIPVKKGQIHCDPSTIELLPSLEKSFHMIRKIENLKTPRGVAMTPDGLLLVAESGNKTIAIVDKDGCIVQRFEHQGGDYPKGVCVTPDNHILVISSHAPHITKYSINYSLVTTVDDKQLQLNTPHHIAVSATGHVYICDTSNHCIQVLNPDLTACRVLGRGGRRPGQFNSPYSLGIDSQNALYICDYGNSRVQKLKSNGTYVSEFKVSSCPRYIAIDSNDVVYIVDDKKVLSLYDSDGSYLGSIDCNGNEGLAIDKQGHIYVCDTYFDVFVFNGMYN